MYFILSKPDDCFLLGYGPGLVLNYIHKLSLLVIMFFIASTVLLPTLAGSQLKSSEAHLKHLYLSPRGAHISHCIMHNSIEKYYITVTSFAFVFNILEIY